MPKQNKTWIIYRHISPSGKSYIGQTCYAQNPNIRWNSGYGYKRCKSFYNAIQKYGWKNIKHEIIETNIKTLEKANQREQYWIEYYDSCRNGYNDTKGGQVLPEAFDNKNRLSVSIGDKYGKYTIIGNPYVRGKRSVVLCKCECGVENVVRLSELCSGKIQSCLHCRNTHKKYNINDLIGKKFGRLTIINETNPKYIGKDHRRKRTITCQCECGNIVNVDLQSILQGKTISCGCFQKEKMRIKPTRLTHGMAHKCNLYNIWISLKGCCYNVNNKRYKKIGAVGIKVCDQWLNDFKSFYDWSYANGYIQDKSGVNRYTLTRIDNTKDFCPENCKYVLLSEHCRTNLLSWAHKCNKGHKVKCVETGIIYHSAKEAGEKTNICASTIGKVCRKDINHKTAGGYHWEYVNND